MQYYAFIKVKNNNIMHILRKIMHYNQQNKQKIKKKDQILYSKEKMVASHKGKYEREC